MGYVILLWHSLSLRYNFFDKTHLENVREINRDPDSAFFPTLDCSILNSQISRDEVRMSVYRARVEKLLELMKYHRRRSVMTIVFTHFLGSLYIDLIMVMYRMNGQRV